MNQSKLFQSFILCLFLLLIQGCNTLDGTLDEMSSVFNRKEKQTSASSSDKQNKSIKDNPVLENTAITPVVKIPAPPIWKRIIQQYKLPPKKHKLIDQEIKWTLKNKLYLQRLEERAAPYLYFIMEEIEKRNMPAELAFLPAVESAYKPRARSSADAVGLWQFIPKTGHQFKLKQNWYYDGRLDAVKATRAALDYLQKLSKLYDGDYELALAAYNLGAGNLNQARKRNHRKKLPTDYWSLKLNKETRHYVPRLRAFAEIFAHPEKYNVDLVYIPDEPAFTEFDISRSVRLDLIANKIGIKTDVLLDLNAAFYKGITPSKGKYKLLIPFSHETDFLSILAKIPTAKQDKAQVYRIKRGDTLNRISIRYHVSLNTLKALNHISGNKIKVGQKILIPSLLAGVNTKKARQMKKSDRPGFVAYEVQAGETVWSISKAFSISHQKILFANNLTQNATLKKGQLIYIPSGKSPSGKKKKMTYTVKDGDSLYLIAKRFSVRVTDIKRWNKLSGRYLKTGQKLILYI